MKRIFPITDIYAITDSGLSLGRDVETVARELLQAGVKLLQYREKKKNGSAMLRECRILRELTREHGAFFIVNDHIDIALLVDADGVHVGQDDLPVPEVRTLVGPDKVIGLSTHNPEQMAEAVRLGADYLGVGPIFPTATKEDVCAAVGLEYLDFVANNCPLPYTAIGGIKRHNIAEVVRHGGRCCCIISDLVSAQDIGQRVQELRAAMRL